MSMIDPWCVVFVGAAAWAFYEYSQSKSRKSARQDPKLKHPREATFTTTDETPWDKKERLCVSSVYPASTQPVDAGVARKWMLVLPTGSQMEVHMSYNKLRKKIYRLKPGGGY